MNCMKLAVALIVVSLLFSCKTKKNEQPTKGKPSVLVEVLITSKEDFASNLEVNGTVLSNEMVELHPEVSGRLTFLNVPDGGSVKAGAILAKINDADLQAQREQLKTQLDLAQKTEKRLNDLLRINGVNQADYDAAISQVNTLQANIKYIDAQLDKTVIRAPFSGQLGLRQVSQGAYVTPVTLIGTLRQTDKVKIDFTVPETYANLVEKGNKVIIHSNISNDTLTATIVAIEPQINALTRNMKVRAFLDGGTILPGAFVKILLDQKRKTILVPSNAIIPDAFTNQVVMIKNNKAVFKTVETGQRNATMVEIISGLTEGDSIVISGMLYVRPDAPVKIIRALSLKEMN